MQDQTEEYAGVNGDELRERGSKWLERIRRKLKDDEEWRKDAAAAEKAYTAGENTSETGAVYDFNILFSNVETIVPAIYNSTPVPDIRSKRTSASEDREVVAKAARVIEAAISAQTDDNALDVEIEAGAQDAYVAGRDVVRVRFEADEEEVTYPDFDESGNPVEVLETILKNERVIYEAVSWRDYVEGPAMRWRDVPWIAFKLKQQKEDLESYDSEYVQAQAEVGEEKPDEFTVWEIWDKENRAVLFVRDSDGAILREVDDPLGLKNFFPIDKPVQPIGVTGKRDPVCPFRVYKALADELDRLTRRINAIVKGLKLVGWYAADGADIISVADAEDNTLVPINNLESAAATGGVSKAIEWWPIDQAVQVLNQLYAAREQTKQTIYEVTGISDIVRGASRSSETATAQQIKNQWGSLRILKMQRMIERQVRGLFVLTSELICANFSERRLAEIAGEQIPPEVMAVLRSGPEQYVIDVESDSTVRGDLTRAKGEMAEFLQGTASYFQSMAPVVQSGGAEIAPPVVELYAVFARQFRLGRSGEEALEKMVEIAKQVAANPKPPQPTPMSEKEKADVQLKANEQKHDQQVDRARLAMEREGQNLDRAKIQADVISEIAGF